jgi:flavin-dependent dehydrogenase
MTRPGSHNESGPIRVYSLRGLAEVHQERGGLLMSTTHVSSAESIKHDVIVIGGGPAGSTSAALLARYGYDVLLLERERFPREHVGESMLPFCYSLFEDLGVLDDLKTRFVRKPGVRFIDRHGHASTTWCFSHVIHDSTFLSFQVIRGEFDHVLLKNAVRLGAKVREEVRVTNVDIASAPDTVWVQSVDASGGEQTYEARFLIDASGRDALVASKNGWRKPREELDRTAIWSHWTGVKLRGGLEEGLSLIIYIGEEKKGWIWVFPLGEDRVTAGMVTQNSFIRDEKRKLQSSGSTDWMYDLMMQELNLSPLVRELLAGTHMSLPVMVNGDYSYEVKNHYGTNYALVGDARGFIDPIFSSGVFLSIKSAYLMTEALHKKLSNNTVAVTPELTTAYERITGAYNFVHRMIRLFYNPHAITWAEAGAEGQLHRQHESALAAGHFMLSGNFFENYEKFHKIFSLLEDRRGFDVYKLLILNRPELSDQATCHMTPDLAFGAMASADALRREALSQTGAPPTQASQGSAASAT